VVTAGPGDVVTAGGPGDVAAAGPEGEPAAGAGDLARARRLAGSVPDPELPMLTIRDLGILRDVAAVGGRIVVSLTPTYTGCPALREMGADVARRLAAGGFGDAQVRVVIAPPWSSDWISAAGRRKLAAAGIAPPGPAAHRAGGPVPLTLTAGRADVACPACGSADTAQTAAFGATACRDLYRCRACREPFEHVKEI
jgi:ring-1,2-phenylacetyl-CoA epoxidase subunit PaaD